MKLTRLHALTTLAVAVAAALLPLAPSAHADAPAPQAAADAVVTDEDTPVSIDVLANDSGALDPSTLTVSPALHGAVQVEPATATVRYTPVAHFSGADSFRYTVCDTASQCTIASVDVTVVFFGRYRIVASHPVYTAPYGVGQLKLQQPDGSGPLEDFPGGAAAYGLQSSISPAGEWLAFNTMSSIEIHSLTNPDDRVSFSLSRPSAPAWSPDGSYLVVESEGRLWRFATPFPSTPVEPAFLAPPKPFTYEVPDGAGGTATVPVLGYNPTWGSRGVAFENWWEYVDPNDANRVSHIGIALVSFAAPPAVLMDGSLHQPDWSSDDRLAVGCPGGLCILSPNAGGQYTSLNTVPGNLTAAQDPNDIQWSPDGSKIAFANRIVNADGSKVVYVNKVDPYTTNLSWDPRPFTPLAAPWTHAGRLAVQRIDHRSGGVHTVQLSKPDTSAAQSANALSDGVRPPRSAVWSPDGRRLALLEADPTSTAFELNVMNADGSNKHRLDGVAIGEIAWSPDGAEIAYLRNDGSAAGTGLFAIHPDGTGKRRITDYGPRYPTYSPDGRFIVFENSDQYGPISGLSYVRADGSAPPVAMQGLPRYPGSPAISRDGHLAFSNFSIYVADVNWDVTPAVSNVRQITFVASGTPNHSDIQPTWSPDSQAIAYSRQDSQDNGPASNLHLYMVNADGSHDARIESATVFEYNLADWGVAAPAATAPAPLIAAVNPSSGPAAGGTAVTITGTGFGGPGTTVSFGGVAAAMTGGSATSLQVTTPAHAAGAVDVVVTNPDAQTATKPAGFAYTDVPPPNRAPTITSIDPSTGPAAGGTAVTITGTFFGGPGTTVKLDGVAVAVTGGSSTSLQITTPVHAAGAVDVVVTNPDNQFATSRGGFTYVNPPPPPPTPAPRISGISPATGTTKGGTQVTITGTDFGGPGTRVSFGGVATTITGGSATSLVVTTPAHSAGAVDVVVTNPDGQKSLRAKGYTYERPRKCIRAFKKKICF